MIRQLLAITLLGAAAASPAASAAPRGEQLTRPMAGRPVADVLRQLQRRGLAIVFSSELVRDDMSVKSEPPAAPDREVLDAILAPHGLEIQNGPGRTLLVVRTRPAPPARPRAATTPAPPVVRGIVVDARTAAPLAGVRITVNGGTAEAVTDTDGRFELAPIAAGEHTLAASLVGYTVARPKVSVARGTAAEVAIALADGTGAYGEEITVTGDRFRGADPTIPSAISLTSADLLELRGVFTDDPLRAAQSLPSVMTGSDHRSEFSVRGSDFGHIGLSIDGVAVGWPIHTVRDDLGAGSVALVNGDVLDSMTLSAGVYPQERPSATGAWLDLSVREGSRAAAQVHGAVGMASASLVVEGPLGTGRGSWLFSGRQSYLQWILARMDADGTRFGFSDVLGKIVYDVTPRQRFQATVVAGRSALDQTQSSVDPNAVRRGTAHTTLAAAGWLSTFGSRTALNQTLALATSGFENDSIAGSLLAEGSRGSVAYRANLSHSLRPDSVVRAGLSVERRAADEHATRYIGLFGDADWSPRVEVVDGSQSLVTSFGRLTHTLGGRLTVDGGVLITTAPTAASPWFTLAMPVGPFTIRGGSGIYRQAPDLEQTVGSFGDRDARPERARHAEAAIEHALGPGLRWQVTVYHRDEHDILHLDGNDYRLQDDQIVVPSPAPVWRNAVDGTARGIECLVQRRTVSGLSGWMSYSWSRTEYRDDAAGERYAGAFDQRHTVSAYGLYRLSPVTSLSARFRYGSNFPIPGYVQSRDGSLFLGDRRHTVRLPPYARLDVRANRAFNFDNRRLTLFAEIVNVLGRSNVAADAPLVLRSGRVEGATQELFPFLPTAGVQIDF